MNRRYVVLHGQQEHPLATAKGELFEHRAVLYEKLGPGSHPCHFCGRVVTWSRRVVGQSVKGHLHVEHLDGDTINNDPENLVPTCQSCNVSAGYKPNRIQPGEVVHVRRSGMTTRAVERECDTCHEAFPAEPSSRSRFCSRRCADAGKILDVCRRGHPRSGENLNKYGQCKECLRLAYRRYHQRQREGSS